MTAEPFIGRLLRLAETASEFGAAKAANFEAEQWTFAREMGWIKRTGQAERVGCDACDDGHEAEVQTDSTGVWHNCLSNGRINLTPDDIALYRVDQDAVLAALARAAGLGGQVRQRYSGGALIRLGFLKSAPDANGWCIGYAATKRSDDLIAAITRALEADYPRGPGLLLVSNADIEPRTLPHKHKLTPVDLVFELNEQKELCFYPERAINLPRLAQSAVPGSTQADATSDYYACAADILGKIYGKPGWPKLRPDQSTRLLEDWPKAGPPKPSTKTIPGYILRYERENGLAPPARGRPKSARRN
jgi:hypothetical protein